MISWASLVVVLSFQNVFAHEKPSENKTTQLETQPSCTQFPEAIFGDLPDIQETLLQFHFHWLDNPHITVVSYLLLVKPKHPGHHCSYLHHASHRRVATKKTASDSGVTPAKLVQLVAAAQTATVTAKTCGQRSARGETSRTQNSEITSPPGNDQISQFKRTFESMIFRTSRLVGYVSCLGGIHIINSWWYF